MDYREKPRWNQARTKVFEKGVLFKKKGGGEYFPPFSWITPPLFKNFRKGLVSLGFYKVIHVSGWGRTLNTLISLGEGGLNWPPRRILPPFCPTNFLARVTRWPFTWKSCATFETIFRKIGHTITTLRDFLYIRIYRPQNLISCTKSMQIVF